MRDIEVQKLAEAADNFERTALWQAFCDRIDQLTQSYLAELASFPCPEDRADFLRGQIIGISRAKLILGDIKRLVEPRKRRGGTDA